MYKLTHGLIDIDTRKYLIQHPESRTRGTHQFKFRVPYANKDVFKFSFFPKTITRQDKTRQDKTTLFYQGSPVSCKAGILRGPGFNKTYIYTYTIKLQG